VAVAAPRTAWAQNASDQATARSLFDEGSRLYAAGQYPEACSKLEASYHLFAGIGTRGKLAECYEKVGRTASAWAMYREVAALAAKAGDATRAQVATDRASALEPKLAHLTVTVPPANDVPGLVVKRSGEIVERGAMGTAVPVDPGTLTFEISAPGKVTQTVDVKVEPASATTFTVPALEAAPVALAPAPAPAPSSAEAPAATPAADTPGGPTWQRPTGLIVAGAGAVTAIVGGVLALTAKSSYDSAFDSGHCNRGTLACDSTGQSQTDGARTQADVGGVLLGVGGALVVGGGVLYFLAPAHASTPTGLQVTPRLSPGVAALSLEGVFQ
jgi:hypothetical protein